MSRSTISTFQLFALFPDEETAECADADALALVTMMNNPAVESRA
jgi:hypothetical protein